MDHPRPGLRYVDAEELDDSTIDFDGLNVESHTGDKLGEVDGVIIDVDSNRLYHIVVNAGGWFSSKYFLLPVGHVRLDTPGERLVADIAKDQVKKYPGFDRDEFNTLSDTELNSMDRQMADACCPGEQAPDADFANRYNTWKHYQNAAWWDSSYYRPDRFDTTAASVAAGSTGAPMTPPSRDEMRADLDARERDRERERERIVARADAADRGEDVEARVGDVSPHQEGRAQPGDVLGIETGGENTHVGDTTDDENQRRRDAEKAARTERD